MTECSFCNNKAIKYDDGYNFCRDCWIEDRQFLMLSKEDQEKVIKLNEKLIDKYQELIDLERDAR